MNQPTYRFWGSIQPPQQREAIRAEITPTGSGRSVAIRLYDPIDSVGGVWGVSAKEFAAALDAIPATVDTIDLFINSPGGEVFQGMAILNMLRAHPATVNVTVEGIAASAASFIAMAGDTITMARNSQMMIHDAMGLAVGNAKTMTDFAALLDKQSDNIADVYARRSGGDTTVWRAAMSAETWFTAEEAVSAGLADKLTDSGSEPTDRFDLSVFNHAGRENAPDPVLPVATDEDTTDVDGTTVEDEQDDAVTADATGSPAADAADDTEPAVEAEIAARLRLNENAALIAFGG